MQWFVLPSYKPRVAHSSNDDLVSSCCLVLGLVFFCCLLSFFGLIRMHSVKEDLVFISVWSD